MDKKIKIIIAMVSLYFFWGTTYLAIRVAIETLPPFMMAGTRFLTAGTILYIIQRMKGARKPTLSEWKVSFVVGGLLLFVGNGLVTLAERDVPSGITSLVVATVPLWIMLISAFVRGGKKPSLGVVVGIVIGMMGIVLLVMSTSGLGGEIPLIGFGMLLIATLAWSIGSVYSKFKSHHESPFMATAMQMLAGGILLHLLSLITREAWSLDVADISMRSVLALMYLVAFGSLVGYNSYIWLLAHADPTWVATYAFVNPVVAVFLGWLILSEKVTGMTIVSAAVILAGVVLITFASNRINQNEKKSR